MPAKIPKPTIPITADSKKIGFLRLSKQLIKNGEELLQTHKTQNEASAEEKTSKDVQKYLKDYLLAVTKTGCSSSTIRNYRSDINQFLEFADSKDLNDLRNKPKLLAFAHYQRNKGLKENSIKRKLVSITQFKIWLKQQGLISSEIPLHLLAEHEAEDQIERKIINQGQKEEPKETKTPDFLKQKKTEKPQSRIFLLLNLLALFLFLGGLAYFAYQQFGQAIISLAYPSTPTAPNSILSYQGRLTNTAQSPIADPTAMTYTLYDNVTGGNVLWSSNTCTIDPDQDGIFNANLGAGAGTGTDTENCGGTIGEDVFTENANVWLEVAIGAETLTPRQPIRTVAYALNATTLQGLPVTEVASNSTILMMNSAGEVVLGTDSPIIKTATSSSGMTIEANQITIQTTAGSNGDIILAPDGDGLLDVQSDASVAGNTTLIGNVNLTSPNNLIFGGSTALGEISSPTDSGAYLIGVYDEFTNSNSTNVQGVLNDLDATIVSAGTPSWSNLTAPSNNLSLNHGTYSTAFNWATGTSTNNLFSLTTDASSNGTGSLLNLQTGTGSTVSPLRVRAGSTEALFVDNAGKVGIGTATPAYLLDVAGDINTTTGTIRMAGTDYGQYFIDGAGTSGQVWTSDGTGRGTWAAAGAASNVPFSGITSGTNTSAAMVVGAGASLNYTSTGTINASSLAGSTWAAPGAIGSTTPNSAAFTTLSGSSTVTLSGLAAGTDNSVLVLNTSNQVVTDEIDSRVWGTSLVDGAGTANQLAYWSDANTLGSLDYSAWDTNESDDVTTFVGLTDTPSAYTGAATKLVRVNATGTALEFVDATGFTDTDNYVDSVAFNTSDGVLTVGRTGVLADLTADLDGRYLTSYSETQGLANVLAVSNSAGTYSIDMNNQLITNIGDAGTDFTSGGGLTLAGTLDVNGNLSIADTDIALDGASTNLTATGNLSVNSDDIFVEKTTGEVGIGTTAPGAKLAVNASTSEATYGSNLLTNGDFASGDFTSWTAGANWSVVSNAALHTAGSTATLAQNISVTDGTTYQIEWTDTGASAGTYTFSIGGVTSRSYNYWEGASAKRTTILASGTSSQSFALTPSSDYNGSIDDLTVRAITAYPSATAHFNNSDGTEGVTIRSGGTGLDNTFVGKYAGMTNTTGYSNSALGYGALYNNTTGYYNSAQGAYALRYNTTGSYNSAQGYAALYTNTTGSSNSAQGYSALRYNTTGYNNSAQGYAALYYNTTGDSNSAQGHSALRSNTTGYSNSAQGYSALYANTTGNYNSAQGTYALRYNTTGSYNSAQGYAALYYLTGTFSNNTAIGYGAGRYYNGTTGNLTETSNSLFLGANTSALAGTGGTNEIVIGYNAIGAGSNSVVLGNDSITKTLLKGNVGIGTTSSGALLGIASANSTRAQLNLVSSASVNPTTPNNGDLWWNGTNLNFYDGSSTVDLLAGGGDSLWVDGGTYIYPLDGESLGNSTSGGTNKISSLYLADNGPLYFGTDNDVNFSFSGSTLATTLGSNSWNIANNLLYLDGANNKIGIGTASPDRKMEIVDASNPQLRLTQTDGSIYTDFNMNANGDLIMNVDGITDQFVLDNGGNVGIGITNPDEKLAVSGSINAEKYYDYTNKNYFLDPAAISTSLKTAGDAHIGGDVGIGTTSPTEKLDVSGNATASGNITMGGQLQTGRFATAPTAIGQGSIIFNTSTNTHQCYNGSVWYDCSGTLYSNTNASVANGSYLTVAHNQNTNDLLNNAWVYDSGSSKWREIATDATGVGSHDTSNTNLEAWYKTEESSGSLSDATSNSNTLVNGNGASAASYSQIGKRDNAVELDGTNDYFSAPDSTSLSPTSQVSLGAWVQFKEAFAPHIQEHDFAVLDKGDYKLVFNRQTGKLDFEVNDSAATSWTTSYSGTNKAIITLAVYNGKLYAGQGLGAEDGDVLVFDGTSWKISYDGVQEYIRSLAVYNGKLYAGQGSGAGDGDVLVFDGSSWTTSYNGTQEYILSLAVYNGKLYAGQGELANGDVLVFDGTSWTTSYNGTEEEIASLAVYNGKLYAGQGSESGNGDVLVFDGTSWTTSYDGTQERFSSLAVYNGKLYAGQGSGAGDGDVLVFDGTSWTTSYDGTQELIHSLTVYNGKLYAGQGSGTGDGDVLVFDGTSWTTSYNGTQEYILSLAVYNGKLYAGQGIDVAGDGDVLVYGNNITASSTRNYWEANRWYHLAATYDSTTDLAYIYIDGTLDANPPATLTQTSGIEDGGTRLYFGSNAGTSGAGHDDGLFNGRIDEAFVYSDILTANEIANLNAQPSPYRIEQVDANNVRLYNFSGTTQNLKLNVTGAGFTNLANPWTDAGSYLYPTGYENLRVYDSGGTNYLNLSHDGTVGILGNNGGSHLAINSSGNIGIGTTAPGAKLEVYQTSDAQAGGIRLTNATLGYSNFIWNDSNANLNIDVGFSGSRKLIINGSGSGYVGIGTTSPTYRLQLPNVADASGKGQANAWVTYSDIRYKTNIRPIENALDKINQLEGVYYNWKSNNVQDVGFIAQQIEPIIPEVVTTDSEGYKGVDYGKLTSLLVQGIKEQQLQISSHSAQLDILEKDFALNYTGDEQEMRLDVIVFGADLAEWYTVNDENIGPADLVAITGEMDDFGVPILHKADKSNDRMLVGVISTQAGTELGIKADNRRLLALDGRVPVKIDPTSSAIEKGDHLTSSGQPGLARKAKPGELSIGRSFETWSPDSGKDRVLVIVNDTMATPSFGQQLVDGVVEIADLLNLKIKDNWEIVNYDTNETIKSAAALAQAIIGKLKVGQMEVSEIKAPEGEKLSLEGSNIAIQLDDSEASGSSALGKLIIQNQDGEIVASFDSEGNASISGQLDVAGISHLGKLMADEATFSSIIAEEASVSGSLIANNIQAESARLDYIESKLANLENASVSGTLYADSIQANSIQANVISGLEERLSSQIAETLNQPSLLAALFGEEAQQTEEYLQQLQQELNEITTETTEATETEATTLTELDQNSNDLTLIADNAFVEQYFEVNGNAFIADSLKLGQSLMIGEDTIVGNGFISYQPQLAEGEEDFTFSIQPTGLGKLSLMAGLMQLDSHGFVSINGDLKVAGVLEVEENLKVKDTLLTNLITANKAGESIKVQLASVDNAMDGLAGEDLTVQKSNFEFINENNTPVASFSSAGDLALTGSLRLSQNTEIASGSGELINSRSAGQAILEAGKTEITIISDKIEENSMIYVTPMNSTNNQVLYVKNKTTDSQFTPENEAQFTVAIDYALGHNVVFNWWIIQLN